jgi:hypothetical protein
MIVDRPPGTPPRPGDCTQKAMGQPSAWAVGPRLSRAARRKHRHPLSALHVATCRWTCHVAVLAGGKS